MTLLAVIRHGPTSWNENGIVQGRSDIPLSDAGRALVAGWRTPAELDGFAWVSSPLHRAVETATILSGAPPATDARLIEMDWAAWEGMRLPELRAQLGDLMRAWEAKGLDFRAPAARARARCSSACARSWPNARRPNAIRWRCAIRESSVRSTPSPRPGT